MTFAYTRVIEFGFFDSYTDIMGREKVHKLSGFQLATVLSIVNASV